MAIRLLSDRVGVSFVQREGEIIELEPDIESRLIESGQAEAVENNQTDDKTESVDQFQNKRQRNRRRYHV